MNQTISKKFETKLILVFLFLCFSKLAIAEELVVSQVGYVDFRIPTDYTSENEELSMDLMAAYDVNGDGYDDLIFGIYALSLSDGWHEENTLVKPVILFWDKSKNRYKPKKRIQMDLPAMYFPRRISGIEVNGNPGVFFANTGLDGLHAPNCGGKNYLIEFEAKKLAVKTVVENPVADYSHTVAKTANDNGLLVLNSPFIISNRCSGQKTSNENYIFEAKNSGFEKAKKIIIKPKGLNKIYYDAALIDRTSESFLIAGRGFNKSIKGGLDLYKIDGSAFEHLNFLEAPEFMRNPSYSEIVKIPDGLFGNRNVYLAISVDTSNGWRGRFLQFFELKQNQLIELYNVLEQPNPQPASGEKIDWCLKVSFFEVKNKTYMACSSRAGYSQGRPTIFRFDNGRFVALENHSSQERVRGLISIRHDTETKLVGWDYAGERIFPAGNVYEKLSILMVQIE